MVVRGAGESLWWRLRLVKIAMFFFPLVLSLSLLGGGGELKSSSSSIKHPLLPLAPRDVLRCPPPPPRSSAPRSRFSVCFSKGPAPRPRWPPGCGRPEHSAAVSPSSNSACASAAAAACVPRETRGSGRPARARARRTTRGWPRCATRRPSAGVRAPKSTPGARRRANHLSLSSRRRSRSRGPLPPCAAPPIPAPATIRSTILLPLASLLEASIDCC